MACGHWQSLLPTNERDMTEKLINPRFVGRYIYSEPNGVFRVPPKRTHHNHDARMAESKIHGAVSPQGNLVRLR